MPAWLTFALIGVMGGIAAGLFGVFLFCLSIYLIQGAARRLGWL